MSGQAPHRVVYIATGKRHIREAGSSLNSLWQHNATTPVTMYVDQPNRHWLGRLGVPAPPRPGLLEILDHPDPTYSWSDKPIALSQGEGDRQRILFLDTDTRICGSIVEIFDLLGPFDLAAAHAPIRIDSRQPASVATRVPRAFPELNTGVIAFRRTGAVTEFLERWRLMHLEILQTLGKRTLGDQAAFRIALYGSALRFCVLSPEYNCRFNFPTYVQGPVRILHGRWPDLQRIERELNEIPDPRVFVPGLGVLKVPRHLVKFRRHYHSWLKQRSMRALRNRAEPVITRDGDEKT